MEDVIRMKLGGRHAVGEHEYALIDAKDAHLVLPYAWKAKPNGGANNVYAIRTERGADGLTRDIRMHRAVLGLGSYDGLDVDHINHNALDNRRCNLRIVTRSENCLNRRVETARGECIYCGTHYEREVARGSVRNVQVCAGCTKQGARLAPSSAVYFPFCVACGARFVARESGHYFCSEGCKDAYRSPRRKPRLGSLETV